MCDSTILILGGYGETGRRLTRLLLNRTKCRIIVAGRHGDRASEFAARLNDSLIGDRVYALELDAADRDAVRKAMQGVSLFIQAGPALPVEVVEGLAETVLDAGADWIDVQLDPTQAQTLAKYRDRMIEEERCFVTQGGFHPGLPALLVRWAALQARDLEVAKVTSYLNQKEGLPFTSGVDELIEMFRGYTAHLFREGEWVKVKGSKRSDYPDAVFPFGIGKRMTTPMDLDELRDLPVQYPSLKETGFTIGGFNWVTNYIVSPIVMAGLRLLPFISTRAWGRFFCWSCRAFARPPFGVVVQVDARGRKNGQEFDMNLALYHDDGYDLTAIPLMATIEQMLDGSSRVPGLHYQGWLPDPERMIGAMQEMGAKVLARITPLNTFLTGQAS